MRNLYLVLISVILLQSCTITKRKYMPGYSVNWDSKAPKRIVNKNPFASRNNVNNHRISTIAVKPFSIVSQNPLNNAPSLQYKIPNVYNSTKEFKSTRVVSNSKEVFIQQPVPAGNVSEEEARHRDSQKEVCKQSKVSMHSGMYSITTTLVSTVLWLMLLVIKNTGGVWASAGLASGVLFGGMITGGALGILAIVFGIIAIHKINKDADVLTGKSKAVTGMVFATILFGILTLMVA